MINKEKRWQPFDQITKGQSHIFQTFLIVVSYSSDQKAADVIFPLLSGAPRRPFSKHKLWAARVGAQTLQMMIYAQTEMMIIIQNNLFPIISVECGGCGLKGTVSPD